jgi:hypothetical protein
MICKKFTYKRKAGTELPQIIMKNSKAQIAIQHADSPTKVASACLYYFVIFGYST